MYCVNQLSFTLPFQSDDLLQIHSGDRLLLTGTLYVARDEAHRRLVDLKRAGKPLPIDLQNQVIYYAGPAPTKPGQVINSIGPTTAKRMDKYTADMLELGAVGIIGKGERGTETRKLLKGKGIYMAALGGVSAKQARCIIKQEIVAFEEIGMEALRRLSVVNFPVICINDLEGRDAYEFVLSS